MWISFFVQYNSRLYHHRSSSSPPSEFSLYWTWLVTSIWVGPVWRHFKLYHSKFSCPKSGIQLGPALGSPCISLLHRFSSGDHGHDPLCEWVSGLFSASHHYIPHGRPIWISGCWVPQADRQAAFSPGGLASWLGLGGDAAHWADHSLVITLQATQNK